MKEKDLLRIIEKNNLDYLNIINSKEYDLGKKIYSIKNKTLLENFKKIKTKFKLKNIKENKNEDNWTKEEIENILSTDVSDKKIVIYTCITENYDVGQTPYYTSNNIDYVAFSNNETVGWIKKQIPKKIKKLNNPILINRYIKFHPYELFADKYDYSIYVDGNILIVSDISVLVNLINPKYGFAFHKHYCRNCAYDEAKYCIALKKGNTKKIKEQMNNYRKDNFPKNYGLLEGNVIVNDLRNETAREIMEQIWNEVYTSLTFRDQLAIPYVLWKNNIKPSEVSTLGKNVYKNQKLRIERHK